MKRFWRAPRAFFRRLFRRKKDDLRQTSLNEVLREFVYLDQISVYSLLASRKGSITAEFTQSQSNKLDLGGTMGVGFAETKPNLNANVSVESVKEAHILSKANIQSHFKELFETENKNLKFRLPRVDTPPKLSILQEVKGALDQLVDERWIIPASELQRGDLLEVEVTLEADPIFRVISVISTICELIEGNSQLFGHSAAAELSQILPIARVLENLLAGLVPIRGHLVYYKAVWVDGKEVLIHDALLQKMPADFRANACPVTLVGVAEHDLFWKDIRRILFSQASYTVFCRLGVSGLADQWQPIKTTNVLSEIAPDFDKILNDFGETVSESLPGKSFGDQRSNNVQQESLELKVLSDVTVQVPRVRST